MAIYSVAIANALGLAPEELQRIRFMAALHDIGKLHVRQSLLMVGPTANSGAILELQEHATLSKKVLTEYGVGDYDDIQFHHERWDGTGYPLRLKFQDIPLSARIIGLAESFDTMHFGRHFAPRRPESECLSQISQQSGVGFDPQVVEAFKSIQPLIQPLGTGAD